MHIANPFAVALVDEYNVFTDAKHRVHVVGVDDGGDSVFVGDVVEKFVDKNRRAGVESRIRFVAEKIFGIQGNCAGNCHAFLHAARDFRGILVFGSLQVDAFKTEACAVEYLATGHAGEHCQGKHHIPEHCFRVKERRALE